MPERHPPKDERRFGGEGSNTQRCGDFFARNASHRNDWRFSMPGGIVHCLIHPKYAQLDVYIYIIYIILCQGVSRAGLGLGLSDVRTNLIVHVWRIYDEQSPPPNLFGNDVDSILQIVATQQ